MITLWWVLLGLIVFLIGAVPLSMLYEALRRRPSPTQTLLWAPSLEIAIWTSAATTCATSRPDRVHLWFCFTLYERSWVLPPYPVGDGVRILLQRRRLRPA